MPRPWSATLKRTCPSSTDADTHTDVPAPENLIALDTRLVSTWTMRSASASTTPSAEPTSSFTPDRSAKPRISATASSINSHARCGRSSRTTRPACIRWTSRTSLSKRIRRSVLLTAMLIIRWPRGESGPSTPPSSKPSEPRMLVSGVRSSWPRTDKSSSFIRSTARRSLTSRMSTWTAGRPSNVTPAAEISASSSLPSSRSSRASVCGARAPASDRLRSPAASRCLSSPWISEIRGHARNSAALEAPNRRTAAALTYTISSSATTTIDSGESSTSRR